MLITRGSLVQFQHIAPAPLTQQGECFPYKEEVTGSSPVWCTIVCHSSSVGRASASYSEGRQFNPAPWHHLWEDSKDGLCNGLKIRIYWFDTSSSHHIFGTVAQLVEHRTENPSVVGSTPTCPTKNRIF